ncbi:uncharacterized protein LOC133792359 [Humulus lupulus]|uniref:uncharacterized protein LOC133792359 n=1 Tax=Humulus lupulus TaxID=3486 RepID=UPI002B4172C2|nr:uncharacterized protein LOC133792359 [Humulus lupulus]
MEVQEVVVIQDSAREVCVNFLKWAVQGLKFKAGDRLTLVSVLHQVNTPLGYRRVDSCSMFGANPKIVEIEARKIQEKYEKDEGIIEISQLFEIQKIEFKIEVATGPSLRYVCVEVAKKLKANVVVLNSYDMINAWKNDREMKNDRKYLLEKLWCGISRIKSNGKIEVLRSPKEKAARARGIRAKHYSTTMTTEQKASSASPIIDEHDLFSIEI